MASTMVDSRATKANRATRVTRVIRASNSNTRRGISLLYRGSSGLLYRGNVVKQTAIRANPKTVVRVAKLEVSVKQQMKVRQ